MNYVAILSDAFANLHRVRSNGQPGGCGRVYVCIADAEHRKGIAAAAKRLRKIYQARAAYGFNHVLYIGYDNNTGTELAYGEAVAAALRDAGISAFREEGGD